MNDSLENYMKKSARSAPYNIAAKSPSHGHYYPKVKVDISPYKSNNDDRCIYCKLEFNNKEMCNCKCRRYCRCKSKSGCKWEFENFIARAKNSASTSQILGSQLKDRTNIPASSTSQSKAQQKASTEKIQTNLKATSSSSSQNKQDVQTSRVQTPKADKTSKKDQIVSSDIPAMYLESVSPKNKKTDFSTGCAKKDQIASSDIPAMYLESVSPQNKKVDFSMSFTEPIAEKSIAPTQLNKSVAQSVQQTSVVTSNPGSLNVSDKKPYVDTSSISYWSKQVDRTLPYITKKLSTSDKSPKNNDSKTIPAPNGNSVTSPTSQAMKDLFDKVNLCKFQSNTAHQQQSGGSPQKLANLEAQNLFRANQLAQDERVAKSQKHKNKQIAKLEKQGRPVPTCLTCGKTFGSQQAVSDHCRMKGHTVQRAKGPTAVPKSVLNDITIAIKDAKRNDEERKEEELRRKKQEEKIKKQQRFQKRRAAQAAREEDFEKRLQAFIVSQAEARNMADRVEEFEANFPKSSIAQINENDPRSAVYIHITNISEARRAIVAILEELKEQKDFMWEEKDDYIDAAELPRHVEKPPKLAVHFEQMSGEFFDHMEVNRCYSDIEEMEFESDLETETIHASYENEIKSSFKTAMKKSTAMKKTVAMKKTSMKKAKNTTKKATKSMKKSAKKPAMKKQAAKKQTVKKVRLQKNYEPGKITLLMMCTGPSTAPIYVFDVEKLGI